MQIYDHEHRQIIKKYRYFLDMLGRFLVVSMLALVGSFVFIFLLHRLEDYWSNVYLTGLGAVVTVAILDRRNAERLNAQRKHTLSLQLGSQSNDFVLEAKRQLEIEGWLEDALKLKQFPDADWRNISLKQPDLKGANLNGVNLKAAHLWSADLTDARLVAAEMSGIDLRHAKLKNAHLLGASLKNADLTEADFEGADLRDVVFSSGTILPNSVLWTPSIDMARFTDPDHQYFWRSPNPTSPAYHR